MDRSTSSSGGGIGAGDLSPRRDLTEAFDTRIDYDDDLKSDTESKPGRHEDYHGSGEAARHERIVVARSGDEGEEGEDERAGRFAISDAEEDDEYRQRGLSARVLFIHGLNRQASERALKDRFSPYGHITSLHIPLKPFDRTPKGYGFVRFSTPEEATAAVEGENRKTFMGVMIDVERAKRHAPGAPMSPRRRTFSRSYPREDDDRAAPYKEPYRREYSPSRGPSARYQVHNDYHDRSGPSSRYGPPPTGPSRDYERYGGDYDRRREPYPAGPHRSDPYGPPPSAYNEYPPHSRSAYPPPSRGGPRDYSPGPPPPAGYYGSGYEMRRGPAGPPPSRYPPPGDRMYPPAGGPPPPGPSYYPAPYGRDRPMPPPPGRRYDGPPPPSYPPRPSDDYDRAAPQGGRPGYERRGPPVGNQGSRPRSPPRY